MGNYKEVSELPNFQQSVNQALSTAGALAGLSGIPQKKAAEKAEIEKEKAAQAELDKKEKILSEQADIAGRDDKADIPGTIQYKIYKDISRERAEVARQQFERNPSNDTYKKYSDLRSMEYKEDYRELREKFRTLHNDKIQQEIAMNRMMKQQEAKKTQRRNFMSYLTQQTIGDLSPDIQKQIASQYNKKQRKTMMDRMDEEAKNGKQ